MDQNIDLIVLDKTARTAKDAAKSLNKEVGSIVKSLLIKICVYNMCPVLSRDKAQYVGENTCLLVINVVIIFL